VALTEEAVCLVLQSEGTVEHEGRENGV